MSSDKKRCDTIPAHAGHRRRIKERFKKNGLISFADYEVLELVLFYAIPRKDVKPIAKSLLDKFGSFQEVLDAPLPSLQQIPDIGEHASVLIKLIRDCSDYYLRDKTATADVISSPTDLLSYARSAMAFQPNEQFRVLYLNAKNKIIRDEILHEGTVDQTAVYPRKVMARALEYNAVALIVFHNHPSGDPLPSSHDKRLTDTIVRAAQILGLTVHDHIIIGENGYFSFKEEGML